MMHGHPLARPFSAVAYASECWARNTWMGVTVEKYPTDLWTYQQIIHATRPTLIIETGTRWGGSALYFANLLDLIGEGQVISIDVERRDDWPLHPHVTYLTGSSTDPILVARVREFARHTPRVMVVLDSDHAAAHVRAELDAYAPIVSPGCYLVVEDTNVNGNPVRPDHGPGPMEALREWLPEHDDFETDPGCERFGVTFFPGGWLRRRA